MHSDLPFLFTHQHFIFALPVPSCPAFLLSKICSNRLTSHLYPIQTVRCRLFCLPTCTPHHQPAVVLVVVLVVKLGCPPALSPGHTDSNDTRRLKSPFPLIEQMPRTGPILMFGLRRQNQTAQDTRTHTGAALLGGFRSFALAASQDCHLLFACHKKKSDPYG